MNPFDGQRQLEVRAEQVVWHLVSAGVLGLLLLLLVVSVALLDGAGDEPPSSGSRPRVARPIEEKGAVPVTHPVRSADHSDLRFDRVRDPARSELPRIADA